MGPEPGGHRRRRVEPPPTGGLEGSRGLGDAGVEPVAQGDGLHQRLLVDRDFEVFDHCRQVAEHVRNRTPVRSSAQTYSGPFDAPYLAKTHKRWRVYLGRNTNRRPAVEDSCTV